MCSIPVFAQLQDIEGKIVNDNEVEGIHILNKTALKYTVTNTDGSFIIPVKLNDTLTISGLKFKLKELRVTKKMLSDKSIKVRLEEQVTQLDQVTVGKILTGNLGSDIKNTKVKAPINFYDLGIPGYIGKPKTLNERKLYEATSGGGLIPLNALLNLLSGRTKELKARIQLDKDIACVERFKAAYKDMIFDGSNLSEVLQERFFIFLIDSEDLKSACYLNKDVFSPIEFLKAELKLFKERLAEDEKKD